MNLTTLEQSKALKAWGAPQDTEFGWPEHGRADFRWSVNNMVSNGINYCAAYDLESLIGWLPTHIEVDNGLKDEWQSTNDYVFNLSYAVSGDDWFASYEFLDSCKGIGMGKTPLEAVYSLCEAVKGGTNG